MSKICTDIPQSKRLIELGLDVNTADMWYAERYEGHVELNGEYVVEEIPYYYLSLTKPSENNYSQDRIKDIPAWSLSALLEILPKNYGRYTKSLYWFDDAWHCEYVDEDGEGYVGETADDPVDACVELIIKLKELNIFPELKESEDEKIRKALIEYFGEQCDMSDWNGVYGYQVLAWLEKQGEHKSVDKVEPKFQNGKWVVWQNKCYKVNYNGCGYELIDQNGLTTSCEYGTIDENAHIWTIADAKPGSVLVCKGNIKYSNGIKYERICLFKNLDNAFFTLTKPSNGFGEYYNIDVNIDYPDNTVPATKEQKEILFMTMKEAGYEWDADTKELKKVEFNPDDLIEESYQQQADDLIDMVTRKSLWSEEDERICQCLIQDQEEALDNVRNDKYGHSEIISDLKEIYRERIDWLKSLNERR